MNYSVPHHLMRDEIIHVFYKKLVFNENLLAKTLNILNQINNLGRSNTFINVLSKKFY